MILKSYLDTADVKQAEFAALVGVTVPTISKLANGLMRPSLVLALRIERATDGKVPVESWDAQPKADAA